MRLCPRALPARRRTPPWEHARTSAASRSSGRARGGAPGALRDLQEGGRRCGWLLRQSHASPRSPWVGAVSAPHPPPRVVTPLHAICCPGAGQAGRGTTCAHPPATPAHLSAPPRAGLVHTAACLLLRASCCCAMAAGWVAWGWGPAGWPVPRGRVGGVLGNHNDTKVTGGWGAKGGARAARAEGEGASACLTPPGTPAPPSQWLISTPGHWRVPGLGCAQGRERFREPPPSRECYKFAGSPPAAPHSLPSPSK